MKWSQANHLKTTPPRLFEGHFLKLKAPWFRLNFANSYMEIETLRLELHENGLKLHDLIIHRKIQHF